MRVLNCEFENHNGLQLIISTRPAIEFIHLDHLELNMLKQNDFASFLSCDIEVIDNEYKFHYPIHRYKKLQHHMQVHCLNQADLYEFTSMLIVAIRTSYSNMLMPDGCIIHPDALFYDEQNKKIMLAYLPVQQKEKLVYSFLQWLLYWSKQIEIDDHVHFNQLLRHFVVQDFTLEQVEHFLFDYMYHVHTGQNKQVETINSVLIDYTTKKQPLNGHPNVEQHGEVMLQSLTTKDNGLHTNTKNSANTKISEEHKNLKQHKSESSEEIDLLEQLQPKSDSKLKVYLIYLLILCLPLGCWVKLYVVEPTLANLLICVGVSIMTLSVLIFLIFRQLNSQKNALLLEMEDEQTDEHLVPYKYYAEGHAEDRLNISSKLDSGPKFSHEKSKHSQHIINTMTSHEIVPATKNEHKKEHLDTVQLGHEDMTVRLGNEKSTSVTLCRMYQQNEQCFNLEKSECIIGRSIDGVHINEDYSGVSRLHLQFEHKNGLVIAKDLGSRNGSYLNDKQMTPYKNYVVNEQDFISLVDKNGPQYRIKWT